jgi:hypothetical protein
MVLVERPWWWFAGEERSNGQPGVATLNGTCPACFSSCLDIESVFFRFVSYFHGAHLHQTFEQVLQHADLPEPGPDYYEARRRLWLTPSRDLPLRRAPSLAQRKLEDMLNQSNAIHSIEVWSNGLERVWQGLCSGGKLKSHLPMNLIVCDHHLLRPLMLFTHLLHKIKIIHASWLRDGTWPAGMEAPSSDDQAEQQVSAASEPDPPTDTAITFHIIRRHSRIHNETALDGSKTVSLQSLEMK